MLILSLYSLIVCLVAAVLAVAVNNLERNRRAATTLKLLIIGRGDPRSFDAPATGSEQGWSNSEAELRSAIAADCITSNC